MSRTSQATIHAPQVDSLLAFTGQPRDPLTGCYHLGNGHRTYNPVLMRFHSADRLSPFGKGGINVYAYCQNDPVNFHDPTGRFPSWITPIKSIIGGFMNLAVSVVKAYRAYRAERAFRPVMGMEGRTGEVATGTVENPVSRWSTRDIAVTAVGAFTASVSIGTGIGRLAAGNSASLMIVDTTVSVIATAISATELYKMAVEPLPHRYPIEVANYHRRVMTPSASVATIRAPQHTAL